MIGTNIDPCVVGSAAMISCKAIVSVQQCVVLHTYRLLPGPVPTHEVLIAPFPFVKVMVWGVVDA